MPYDQNEIAEKTQRVALLQKGYVPSKAEAPAPELTPTFDEKRGAEFIADVTPSVVLPVSIAAGSEPGEIPANEIGIALSDKELDAIGQKPQAKPNADATTAQPGPVPTPQPDAPAGRKAVMAETAVPPSLAKQAAANATGAAVGSAYQHVDSEFVGETHRRAGEDNRRDFFMSQNTFEDGGTVVGSGRRTHGNFANAIAQKESQRRKEKDAEAYRRALKAHLDALYADIEKIDLQIKKNNEALETIQRIRELAAKGEFDPRTNPDHAQMLQKVGVSVDEYEENPQQALDEREDELNRENERLAKEREEKVQQIREIEATADPVELKAYNETRQLRSENVDIQAERIFSIQPQSGVRDTSDLGRYTDGSQDARSVDSEVGDFMKAFAETASISDPLERLGREKELVDRLSAEARENLSWESSTEHLFADGYFDSLESKRAAAAPSVPGPSPT